MQGPGGGVRVEGPEDERQDEQVEDEDEEQQGSEEPHEDVLVEHLLHLMDSRQ